MDAMIRSMSVQEREEMMLLMKPEMMKKADMQIMMKNMMPMMSEMIGDSKECMMSEIVDENPKIGEHMGGMMSKLCPLWQAW